MKLLVPIARSLGISLDDLLASGDRPDPWVARSPIVRDGITILPLSGSDSAIQVFHQTVPAGDDRVPRLQLHEGYEWA